MEATVQCFWFLFICYTVYAKSVAIEVKKIELFSKREEEWEMMYWEPIEL
jgi:hypothetical protein